MPRYRDWQRRKPAARGKLEQVSISVVTSLVLGIFQGLRFLKWLIAALFLLLANMGKTVSVWLFRHVLFPGYRATRGVRHWLGQKLGGHHHLIIRMISHRVFLRVMAVATLFALLGWNQLDHLTRADAYGADMPVALVVQSEEEFLIEEGQLAEKNLLVTSTAPFDDSVQVSFETQDGSDDLAQEQTITTAVGSTALLKPVVTGIGQPSTRTEPVTYVVETGDTIASIAEKHDISVNTILWANKLTARSILRPGQSIKILPTSGIAHKVVRGDTLATIARKYKIDTTEIQKFNGLDETSKLALGQELVIPGAKPLPAPAPIRPPRIVSPANLPPVVIPKGTGFMWPLASRRITQYYNFRHHALDVGTPTGSPIYSSTDGVVEQARAAGWNGGYGKMLIINHGGGLSSLYAHNSRLLVTVGEQVTKGQVIALSGNTGRSSGPHLHFEIWIGQVRQNPLSYIR